ncbi:hypothetical protein MW887_009799 [Aspergillus wentii]|nr:hypothetical protein MW887_009799 [Aspergillus wentii]
MQSQVPYRSVPHDTTSINGIYQKDPNGWHITFCYKDQQQLDNKMHTACHGYLPAKDVFELTMSTHVAEKADATIKGNGMAVWPSEDILEVAPEVGYSHLPDPAETRVIRPP